MIARVCKYCNSSVFVHVDECVLVAACRDRLKARLADAERVIRDAAMRLRVSRGQGYMPKSLSCAKVLDAEIDVVFERENHDEEHIEKLQAQVKETERERDEARAKYDNLVKYLTAMIERIEAL